MAENELVLKQRNSLGFDTQIKLLDGRELQVIRKGKNTQKTYSVDILSLQDKSKTVIVIAWKWLVSTMLFFSLMLLMLKVLPSYLSDNKNLYLGAILLFGSLSSLFCFIRFFKHTSRKHFFYSLKSNVPIIELAVGKPSKEKFSLFICAIEKRIKESREQLDISDDQQLVGEIKMLRRLSDDEVISKKMYEHAKTKLFTGFDSQVINREV